MVSDVVNHMGGLMLPIQRLTSLLESLHTLGYKPEGDQDSCCLTFSLCIMADGLQLHADPFARNYQLPITKWPHQSGAPVGAAPPTRCQLRLEQHIQLPVQNSHHDCHQPTLDPLLANYIWHWSQNIEHFMFMRYVSAQLSGHAAPAASHQHVS